MPDQKDAARSVTPATRSCAVFIDFGNLLHDIDRAAHHRQRMRLRHAIARFTHRGHARVQMDRMLELAPEFLLQLLPQRIPA